MEGQPCRRKRAVEPAVEEEVAQYCFEQKHMLDDSTYLATMNMAKEMRDDAALTTNLMQTYAASLREMKQFKQHLRQARIERDTLAGLAPTAELQQKVHNHEAHLRTCRYEVRELRRLLAARRDVFRTIIPKRP